MGREVGYREYAAQDYEQFNHRIHDQVDILKKIIDLPEFGLSDTCIGAKIELYLMNEQSDVSPVNLQLLQRLQDNQFQPELNQFNLELNLIPVKAAGNPFSQMTKEMLIKFNYLWEVAEQIKTRPLAVGILPTLKKKHLSNEYVTHLGRYRVICRELLKQRGEPFHIQIEGQQESVDCFTPEVSVEGTNTSFQVHLMTDKDKFANTFNAAQMTMPMAIALAANSGVLLGKYL